MRFFLNFAMMWLAPACETAASSRRRLFMFSEEGGDKVATPYRTAVDVDLFRVSKLFFESNELIAP